MALEMLADGRVEELIPPGNLGRRILHQTLGRLQPARTVPVPISLARSRAMLVVISPSRITGFALKRLLHDQPGCQLHQLVLCRRCGKTLDQCRFSPSRVRCDAGILVTMGCSFAGPAKARC